MKECREKIVGTGSFFCLKEEHGMLKDSEKFCFRQVLKKKVLLYLRLFTKRIPWIRYVEGTVTYTVIR